MTGITSQTGSPTTPTTRSRRTPRSALELLAGLALILSPLATATTEAPFIRLEKGPDGIEIVFAGGVLEKCGNLNNWEPVQPAPSSPYAPPEARAASYYRVRAYATEDQVPVIAFTGQSNTLHNIRNYPPYSTTFVPIPFGFAVGGAGGVAGSPSFYDTITDAVRSGRAVGAVLDFSYLLERSEFRRGHATRFVVCQTGAGGRAAWEWRYYQPRGIEFQATVDGMLANLNAQPNTSGYLHTVVVNQGEREAATGQNWAVYWTDFIDSTRQKYGNQVQIYIQSLNALNLMPVQANLARWTSTKTLQLSVATGSGSANERPGVAVFDADSLGGEINTATYVRDNFIHYSDLGIWELARGTYTQFKAANAIP